MKRVDFVNSAFRESGFVITQLIDFLSSQRQRDFYPVIGLSQWLTFLLFYWRIPLTEPSHYAFLWNGPPPL